MSGYTYIAFYKPFNVLSQFTKEIATHQTIADYLTVKSDIYPVGRLDKDSEGLLLLTNDKQLNYRLLNPSNAHPRTYHVQVDGEITPEALSRLESGISIKLGKIYYKTLHCQAYAIDAPSLPERIPPIRVRKNIPTSWISITLIEGKNRQVRKMCAGVGFPVLRLVRVSINKLKLEGLNPGEFRYVQLQEILKQSL